MESICAACGKGRVVPRAAPGRRFRYQMMPALEIPDSLRLPTCERCGELWLDATATRRLESALRKAYARELATRTERALRVLSARYPNRELETLLGLSQGTLARLEGSCEAPSAALTGLLMLLAEAPSRVAKLRALWEARPRKIEAKKSSSIPRLTRKR
jgi:hypothetical protein